MRSERALRRCEAAAKGRAARSEGSLGKRFVWVPSRKGVDEFLSQYGRLDGRRGTAAGSRAERAGRTEPWARSEAVLPASPRARDRRRPRARLAAAPRVRVGADPARRALVRRARAARRLSPRRGGESRALARRRRHGRALRRRRTSPSRSRAPASPGRGRSASPSSPRRSITATFFASSAAGTGRRSCSGATGSPSASRIRCSARTSASSSSRSRSSSWCPGCCSGSSRSRPRPSALVYRAQDALSLRPLRATYEAQVHLAALAAALPARRGVEVSARAVRPRARPALARRQRLVRGRRIRRRPCSLARARGTVDPGRRAGSRLRRRPAHGAAADTDAVRGCRSASRRPALVVALVSVGSWLPALVQRFAVNPNPLAQRTALLGAVDRGDEERPRARCGSRCIRTRQPAG